ncbi:MAG: hypothetical protein PPHEINF_5531 [uncultured Paraburkholderia sp.]|nr:MAG: hypothetical protein PPHEINF_5531 [uncultured Paraburkholderia sp.]CAH2805721.1 MAG: hypothetical protein PPHEESC_5597 [uncultured Paraburkholderia sp.]CAH2941418.1 MAG: hypothetical protein PPHEMADMSA_5584 [uncultured Paraburkholderia sp.]CAH2942613.1 MAG: hypothetical protein PPHERAN_5593 [uncultured Paraburkholderia sp.]
MALLPADAAAIATPGASNWRRFAEGTADELANSFLRTCDVVVRVPLMRHGCMTRHRRA